MLHPSIHLYKLSQPITAEADSVSTTFDPTGLVTELNHLLDDNITVTIDPKKNDKAIWLNVSFGTDEDLNFGINLTSQQKDKFTELIVQPSLPCTTFSQKIHGNSAKSRTIALKELVKSIYQIINAQLSLCQEKDTGENTDIKDLHASIANSRFTIISEDLLTKQQILADETLKKHSVESPENSSVLQRSNEPFSHEYLYSSGQAVDGDYVRTLQELLHKQEVSYFFND